MNPLNPKKLLLTKWTAVKPVAKQCEFEGVFHGRVGLIINLFML